MRISDWSSDVCSSDLLIKAAISDDHRTPGRFDDVDHALIGKQLSIRKVRQRTVVFYPYQATAVDPSDQAEWRCKKQPSRSGKRRSEEHTSELQSLMRISYAVVCMKTNKKHNNTQIK